MNRTRTAALTTVIANPSLIVNAFCEHRLARGINWHIEFASAVDIEKFVQARLRRGEKKTIGVVIQAFVTAKNTNQFIYFIVVRLHVFVANWPVVTEAVYVFTLKVERAEAQGYAPPMVCASA